MALLLYECRQRGTDTVGACGHHPKGEASGGHLSSGATTGIHHGLYTACVRVSVLSVFAPYMYIIQTGKSEDWERDGNQPVSVRLVMNSDTPSLTDRRAGRAYGVCVFLSLSRHRRIYTTLYNVCIRACVRTWEKSNDGDTDSSMSFCGSIVCTHVPESQDVSVRLCPVKSAVIAEFVSSKKGSPKVLQALPNAPIFRTLFDSLGVSIVAAE